MGRTIFFGLILRYSLSPSLCIWEACWRRILSHLIALQEQAVQVLSSNKAPFRRYPECFLVLVGLSPYYPFDENTYPAFERPDKTDMGLLDYIRTADPRKVQAVEVQKGEEQVTLLESIKHCFVSLDAPAAVHQASGSGSGAGPEVSAPSAGKNVVAEENVIPVGTYVDLIDPEDDLTVVEKGDAAQKQPEKAKRKKLSKQSDPLPAKRLRVDHPSLASGTGGKTLASLRRTIPEGSLLLGTSPADVHTQVTVRRVVRKLGNRLKFSTAFHPETDGQSERTIQTLEDMLRSCALEWAGNWDDYYYEMSMLLFVWDQVGEVFLRGPELIEVIMKRSPSPGKSLRKLRLVRRVTQIGMQALEFQRESSEREATWETEEYYTDLLILISSLIWVLGVQGKLGKFLVHWVYMCG
ncbi:putative nucleotidyltransferase, ribonuclease H [Tanacetum coccineum]